MALSTYSSENRIPEVANDALRASFRTAIACGTVLFVKEGRVFRQEKTGSVVSVKTLPARKNTDFADTLLKSKVLKRKRHHVNKETAEAHL